MWGHSSNVAYLSDWHHIACHRAASSAPSCIPFTPTAAWQKSCSVFHPLILMIVCSRPGLEENPWQSGLLGYSVVFKKFLQIFEVCLGSFSCCRMCCCIIHWVSVVKQLNWVFNSCFGIVADPSYNPKRVSILRVVMRLKNQSSSEIGPLMYCI